MDPVGKKLAQSKQIWSAHVRRTNYVTPQNNFLIVSPLEDEDLDNSSSGYYSLALQPQWALAYLHETLRFTSVFFF
jgi:hypothetical protein